jgi:hypothetical protein
MTDFQLRTAVPLYSCMLQIGKKDGAVMKFAMCVHNAILCLLSAAMCAGAGYEAYLRSQVSS